MSTAVIVGFLDLNYRYISIAARIPRDTGPWPAVSRQTCDQHMSTAVIVGFLDLNYRYISIAARIPRDTGLAPPAVHPC